MRTDKDWADKEWLDRGPDPFQLITPDLAIFILVVGLFVGFVFERFL